MLGLSRLFFYPIKGARGVEVSSARVTPLGLEHDRRFMFVDEAGVFVSQREHPALARMVVTVEDERLLVHVDGLGAATAPLVPEGAPLEVEIWRDRVDALRVEGEVEALARALLGAPVRLAYFPATSRRQVDLAYAEPGDSTHFADGFPLLVVGAESAREVARQVGHEVPIERFRPSLVVEGAPAFDEDTWREITVAGRRVRLPKPCARCAVTTVDHLTGERGREPLATLARTRKVGQKVMFGMNALIDGDGTLRVGDAVAITRRAPAAPPELS